MTCRCTSKTAALTMAVTGLTIGLLYVIIMQPCTGEEVRCADDKLCPKGWQCCEQGCCASATPLAAHAVLPRGDNPWYTQWSVLFVLGTLAGILICCIWCLCIKSQSPEGRSGRSFYLYHCVCCVPRRPSAHDSAGSIYPPPRYSRCSSFHQAPPPYSEVTAKPDLYPLVITCGEGDAKSGGNYLMVQYFRNYVIRAPGSLSAASTAESLNSSYLCNAANEANSIIPPPYSCAGNYEECGVGCGRSVLRSLSSLTERERERPPARTRAPPDPATQAQAFRDNLITSPVQPLDPTYDLELELIDCEMYCDSGCKPRLGPSPPVHRSSSNIEDSASMYEREAYGLRHLLGPAPGAACESPPQPTSPTQSRESTLRRPTDDRHRRLERLDSKKTPKSRKSSLYMPLSMAYPVRTSRISPGARASSRSAPATPCGSLVPNLLNFTQRVSTSRLGSRSSRFDEESDPLLLDIELSRADHKF